MKDRKKKKDKTNNPRKQNNRTLITRITLIILVTLITFNIRITLSSQHNPHNPNTSNNSNKFNWGTGLCEGSNPNNSRSPDSTKVFCCACFYSNISRNTAALKFRVVKAVSLITVETPTTLRMAVVKAMTLETMRITEKFAVWSGSQCEQLSLVFLTFPQTGWTRPWNLRVRGVTEWHETWGKMWVTRFNRLD
jgi:hypothetical protein